MRRLFSGLVLLVAIWAGPPSFADRAPPSKPKQEPAPPPKPEPKPLEEAKNCDLKLEEFMETKIKGTIKDTTLTKDQIDARLSIYYQDLAAMVPDPKWNEGINSWKSITEKTIDKKAWGTSCKTCHKAFESKYNKLYHDKKVCFTTVVP